MPNTNYSSPNKPTRSFWRGLAHWTLVEAGRALVKLGGRVQALGGALIFKAERSETGAAFAIWIALAALATLGVWVLR
ncbi:hypothetical protein [Microcystis phage Mae-JY35]